MNISFAGKRALVTGAGKGIGRSVTIKLAECGAEVIAISRTQSDLEELSKISDKIKTICLDVGNWEATKVAIENIDSIDLLVNNAGIIGPHNFGELTEEAINEVYNINVKAIINITQLIANDMKSRGHGGSIVNVSSIAGFRAGPEIGLYSSSKGAVDQLTRSMAVEYGPHQIRVNSVNPTAIRTQMAAVYFDENSELAESFREKTPLKRLGEVDEVVYPILFLLSDYASMITGTQPVIFFVLAERQQKRSIVGNSLSVDQEDEKMNISFDGKKALVTGAGKGIGRGIAIKLAECGAEVIAISRTQSDLEELSKVSDKIKTIRLDVGNWEATKAAIEDVGSVDLVVNNAAIAGPANYGKLTEEEIDEVYNINVKAIINITQLIANDMKSRGRGGSIVNVSSVAGFKAGPEVGIYASSKGAVDQLTRSMAVEFGPHQIRVNSVNPTAIRTRMAEEFFNDKSELAKVFTERTPLRRLGEVEDVVYPVLFLLSDYASMISGVTLPIDGGLTVSF